ncbi:hypothetical protein GAMM_90022 [Gammaproteobacteria bacterium]
MSLCLCSLLDIGWCDLEFIEKHYRLVRSKITFTEFGHIPLEQINANMILYQIFLYINNEVFNLIKNRGEFPRGKKKQITNICDERVNEFSPFLNCFDSCFNNEIDEVNIEGKVIEEMANEVYFLLLQNIQNVTPVNRRQ